MLIGASDDAPDLNLVLEYQSEQDVDQLTPHTG